MNVRFRSVRRLTYLTSPLGCDAFLSFCLLLLLVLVLVLVLVVVVVVVLLLAVASRAWTLMAYLYGFCGNSVREELS